jgi:undecaprenyl-diphosphatase
MLELDERAFAAVYGGAHGPWSAFMTALTIAGSGWAAVLLVPLAAWPRRGAVRDVSRALAAAVALQALLVVAIKAAMGRVRPWIAMGLPAPIGSPHDHSFPSGHAAGAFCVAGFLVAMCPCWLPGSPWRARAASAAALALAALVALSRVYLGAHFPSDVVAGGALGGGIGLAAARAHLAVRSARPGGSSRERRLPRSSPSPDTATRTPG